MDNNVNVTQTCPNGIIYTIRAGDTLFSIAGRYNVTVDAILRANPGLDPDNLRVGQRICIPGVQSECPAGSFQYTIRSGDTLFQLARRFNTTVDAILDINPGLDPTNLRVGQVICIPREPMPGRCPSNSFEYTIRAGDTIFQLARRFNTTVQAILDINPGLDPDNLRVGQIICIPGRPQPGECPPGSMEYTIRAGDTLFQLARRFNTTVQAILDINPGLDPDNLRVGQVICIPGQPGVCPPGTMEYTIRAGDTYFRLAQRFGVSVDDIIAANPGVDPNRLQIGQVICIPQPDVPPCPGGRIYVIRPGDTLFQIAQRNNISLDKLIAANPQISDPDRITVGTSICIPSGRQVTAQQAPCPAGTFEYTVRAGDTYFRLAQQFNTTVEAITRANPNVNPNNLQIGQRICIPGAAPPPGGCPAGTFEYTVRAGDTYFRLAQQFNTTVEAITRANPGVNPNALQVGQRICIPGAAPPPGGCPAGTFEYTVRAGDTYFRLAQQFNTTVEAITRANPGVNPNALQVGQRICIPGAAPPPGGCPAGTFEYTVRAGDTYFRLAQQFNTTVEAITRANPGVDPNALQIGQRICIPRT